MNAIRILIVAALALAASGAQADTFTFNGDVDNTWNEDGNWLNQDEETGTPGATDTAIIPAFKSVKTDAQDAECKILEIAFPGKVEISEGSTFTLHGGSSPGNDSTIDAFINFIEHDDSDDAPVFKIMNDTTIVGGTGFFTGFIKGIIRGNTSSTTLTIEKEGVGLGLALAGTLDVEIKLVNNSWVVTGAGTLTLKTNEKSGNGLWEANSVGILNIDAELTGTGMLWLTGTGEINIGADSPDFAGDIWCNGGTFTVNNEIGMSDGIAITAGTMVINTAVSTTGHVVVGNGTLTVNEDFCTTGNIRYVNGGTITVAGGATPKSASFGGVCSSP